MDLAKEFALIALTHGYVVTGNPRLLEMANEVRNVMYVCPYCGKEHNSPNGSGSDVICCGERGHAEPSLCTTCAKADKSCPIWPQQTQTCVEYKGEPK